MIRRDECMYNFSIMPLDEKHLKESCDDIIEQQKNGISTHAMLMMYFRPDGTPPVNTAQKQCEIFDKYKHYLDKAGAKYGVLVQSTLGHITLPSKMHPFQTTVSLETGEESLTTCCPLDPGFKDYIKNQMKTLAKHNPSIIMIDDDIGILYRNTKGCCCKYHMEEFNRRAKTNMTREQLYSHTISDNPESKRYTDIYVELIKDSLISCVKAMREGIDEVNPQIQGAVSGIYVSTFCEFSGDIARAFAGEGNPVIMRLNGGPYAKESTHYFTSNLFRASILRENVKDKVDIFLAETDTCPQNRYSTSAAMLHGHFTASILEGACGAKHWITRTMEYEPSSGRAYRKILSRYSKFYERLSEYVKELKPFGCKIPLTLMQNYGFVEVDCPSTVNPWISCILERFGLPVYFSNEGEGAVFLDEFSVDGFDDKTIMNFLKGTLVLSAGAAKKLFERGFSQYTGVDVAEWTGKTANCEIINGKQMAVQYGQKQLVPLFENVEWLSDAVHEDEENSLESLFPAVTRFKNSLGGEVIVFSGNPDMPFTYYTAFSMLNETRKQQFIDILSNNNHIPLYYPEDAEVYLRAGYLESGEIMAAVFNLGHDVLDDIPLVCTKKVNRVEMLCPDGTREVCKYAEENGIIRIKRELNTLIPAILFIS